MSLSATIYCGQCFGDRRLVDVLEKKIQAKLAEVWDENV